VRENSILPLGASEEKPDWKLSDHLTLQLFQIAENADVTIAVPPSDGPPVQFRCRRTGTKITLSSDGRAKDISVLLPSHRFTSEIANGKLRSGPGETAAIAWIDTSRPLGISLKD
jgi:alpha-D-xyloside xylohydrolase